MAVPAITKEVKAPTIETKLKVPPVREVGAGEYVFPVWETYGPKSEGIVKK